MKEKRVTADSLERYNAGAAHKRRFGSSTVTTFLVTFGGTSLYVRAAGSSPSARKAIAIQAAAPYLEGPQPIPARNSLRTPIEAYPD